MLPFDSWALPVASKCALITAKLALTVSAASKSCGKNFFPVSKSFPTMSRAGTMHRSIISTGNRPSPSNFLVASADESLKPLQIIFTSDFSDSERFSGTTLGVPLRSLSLPSGRVFRGSAIASLLHFASLHSATLRASTPANALGWLRSLETTPPTAPCWWFRLCSTTAPFAAATCSAVKPYTGALVSVYFSI